MKSLLKLLLKSIVTFVLLVLLYLGSEYVLSSITVKAKNTTDKQDISIYILTNGVHTDIVMPVHWDSMYWNKLFPYSDTRAQDSSLNYIAIGWGDRGFYMETPEWKDLKFSVAFKAVFGLGKTALHTTYYQYIQTGEDCKEIKLSASQYHKLCSYIIQSLHDYNMLQYAKVIPTDAQYGNNDAFYEAKGSYSLFTTCNTWANTALKRCEQKASLWTAFKRGIFYQYK